MPGFVIYDGVCFMFCVIIDAGGKKTRKWLIYAMDWERKAMGQSG